MSQKTKQTLTYTEAVRYATVISRDHDAKDLVHNAFLYHYELTGGDMFDQPKGYVLRCIKNAWRRRYRATQFIFRGELVTPKILDIWDHEVSGGITPERALMSKEFVDEFHRRIDNYRQSTGRPMPPSILKEFLRYLEDGYTVPEIEVEMNVSRARLHKYTAKFKSIVKSMQEYEPHNPFNGNNVVPVKVVKRETYEKNPGKYSEFVYDTDRGADFNEYFMLLVNEKGEGLLIRE